MEPLEPNQLPCTAVSDLPEAAAATAAVACDPDAPRGRVVLRPHKGGPFFAHHPWVMNSSISAVANPPTLGGVVDVVAENGRWIAHGLFNPQSRIRVRLYSWQPAEVPGAALWRQRLEQALALRQAVGYNDPQGAARLVFSEADGLSGLVVDRFGPHLVVQVTAAAMFARREEWLPALVELTQPRSVRLRVERALQTQEGLAPMDEVVWGQAAAEAIPILENGIRYLVDPGEGQKTGFYLDQRENRRAAAQLVRGRRVLDVCCYSGGFALACAVLGQAAEVRAVDSSSRALALARENARLNGAAVDFVEGDCFETLEALVGAGEKFGTVVLDPPRFAGNRRAVEQALRAYHRLNRLAVQLIEPGGFLVTCSCSGHVSRDDFARMLAGVAQKTQRELQILEQRGASPDHPVRTSCPESEYLKCFLVRVL